MERAYVATTVWVVVVVVKVRVLIVLVGVGAVLVMVVFALPEYAVTGGGVLKLLAALSTSKEYAYTVLVIEVSVVMTSVTAGAVTVVVVDTALDASVVEVQASVSREYASYVRLLALTYLVNAWPH